MARKFEKPRQLLPPCIHERGGNWADLGSGEGIFTAVLYELVGPTCQIYAIDKNQRALEFLTRNFKKTYPDAVLYPIHADFTQPLSLPPLTGLVMANALHFIPDKQKPRVLSQLIDILKSGGKIIIVEYNARRGNPAVPFPLNEDDFLHVTKKVGLLNPKIVKKVPSTFLREMYAGTALAP